MSTEGLINIYSGNKRLHLVSIVSHYDGYVDNGLGSDLAKFLSECDLVNGIPGSNTNKGKKRYSNGMDCLAAQVITHLKGDENIAGGIYVVGFNPKDPREDSYYCYEIYERGSKIMIDVYDSMWDENMDEPVFSGPATDLANFINKKYWGMINSKIEEEEAPRRKVAVKATKKKAGK